MTCKYCGGPTSFGNCLKENCLGRGDLRPAQSSKKPIGPFRGFDIVVVVAAPGEDKNWRKKVYERM
jgi:hypothetical protein